MPFDGEQMCVMWMPLDVVPRESALEFVRASHADGRLYHFATAGHGKMDLPPVPDIESRRGDFDIVGFASAPGDVVVFHMRMLHGTATRANVSNQRRTLSTRWAGEDVRVRIKGRKSALRSGLDLPEDAPIESERFPPIWSRGRGLHTSAP